MEVLLSSLSLVLVLSLDDLLRLLGLLGQRSAFIIVIFFVRGGLLGLGLRLALARSGGSDGRRSGGAVISSSAGSSNFAGLLLQFGEALAGATSQSKIVVAAEAIIPDGLLGLAHLLGNLLPVRVDLGDRDDGEKELTVLSVVPGSHCCFLDRVLLWICVDGVR